jgi:phosphoadenosine phosphosulfate reductase
VDTGDLLPEVREIVRDMESAVPRFARIDTSSLEWTSRVGLPSDLVPTSCTPAGLIIGMSGLRIVDRFDCCASNIMAPMHHRMLEDGITLVIRGTKRADFARMPAENGPTGGGYDLWLPIADWSHEDVFTYLSEIGVTLPRFYETRVNAPECATCPAWWSEGRAAYLREHHPDLFAIYQQKLGRVAREVAPHLTALQTEMSHG